LIYWRYGDYLGVGPGAHGRIVVGGRRIASSTLSSPEQWLASVSTRGEAISQWDVVADVDAGTECLLMSLRLREGLSRSRVERLLGRSLTVERASAAGLIALDGDRITALPRGRLVLNAVIKELLSA
jgi:oxygen-independent coproporphyrinogen-3 oxidase